MVAVYTIRFITLRSMKITILAALLILAGCTANSKITGFTQAEIDYFLEIALGAEFGDDVPVIKKWTDDIRIKISGSPTSQDLQTIKTIVEDLKTLSVKIKIVDKKENVNIIFTPEKEFSKLDDNYVPKNYGFFWSLWHDDNYEIYEANILVASTEITQQERSHLIREELTQSLGLMNDSDKYKDSIFYQNWTDITDYSEIDKTTIRLLYHKNIKTGMTKDEILEILNSNEIEQ